MSRPGRASRRLASIDIGTNSVRLLLADITPGGPLRTRVRQGAITRLGQGLDAAGRISREAAQRTLEAVRNFVEEAEYGGAETVVITGTSALRQAANGPEVAAEIAREVGYDVRILPGEEEARLVYRAVGAERVGPRTVIDIGGGSTEVIHGRPGGVLDLRSVPVGAVSMTERFGLAPSLPAPAARDALDAFLRDTLGRGLAGLAVTPETPVFGVGGTVTALAASDKRLQRYDPSLVEGHVLGRARIADLTETLWRTPLEGRRAIPGVSEGRADIILAGADILLAVLDRLGASALIASTRGLRYGILLEATDEGIEAEP